MAGVYCINEGSTSEAYWMAVKMMHDSVYGRTKACLASGTETTKRAIPDFALITVELAP